MRRVNTTLERQKGRNLLANPKASLLVVDPDDTARFIQIRGDSELVNADALEHLEYRAFAFRDFVDSADLRALERHLFDRKMALVRERLRAAS